MFSYRSFSELSEKCVSLDLAKESRPVLEKLGVIYALLQLLVCNMVLLD